MKTNNQQKYYLLTAFGLILFLIGGIGFKTNWFENIPALPGIFVGIGTGSFGMGLGEILKNRTIEKSPAAKKKYEIEQNDERNIEINFRSKSKAFDFMGFVFPVTMFICILLNADFLMIILLVAAYLLIYAVQIYYFIKYQKEL